MVRNCYSSHLKPIGLEEVINFHDRLLFNSLSPASEKKKYIQRERRESFPIENILSATPFIGRGGRICDFGRERRVSWFTYSTSASCLSPSSQDDSDSSPLPLFRPITQKQVCPSPWPPTP
jgi:hypothetical protein